MKRREKIEREEKKRQRDDVRGKMRREGWKGNGREEKRREGQEKKMKRDTE